MTINSPNPGSFQSQLTDAIVTLRDAFQVISNLNDYITAQGGATFLENSIGLSAGDAAVVVSTFANHATLDTAYNGGAQAPVLNYKENGNLLWGGR
jgi:hypothetical protein